MDFLSDTGSIPVISTKWTLHEHLLFLAAASPFWCGCDVNNRTEGQGTLCLDPRLLYTENHLLAEWIKKHYGDNVDS